jgi:DNA-directed RNA polymerase specialized sigma subunit
MPCSMPHPPFLKQSLVRVLQGREGAREAEMGGDAMRAIDQESLTDEQVDAVNNNLGLVHKFAARPRGRLEFDDRFQAGCLGLIRAVQLYDPSIAAFSTYAARWIKQAIARAAAKAVPMAAWRASYRWTGPNRR